MTLPEPLIEPCTATNLGKELYRLIAELYPICRSITSFMPRLGINLAVGCLSRTPYDEYPEYHTSADNLDLVQPDELESSYDVCQSILKVLEGNVTYVNRNPMCQRVRSIYRFRPEGDHDRRRGELLALDGLHRA
jgi:aminopeptidase-like protein